MGVKWKSIVIWGHLTASPVLAIAPQDADLYVPLQNELIRRSTLSGQSSTLSNQSASSGLSLTSDVNTEIPESCTLEKVEKGQRKIDFRRYRLVCGNIPVLDAGRTDIYRNGKLEWRRTSLPAADSLPGQADWVALETLRPDFLTDQVEAVEPFWLYREGALLPIWKVIYKESEQRMELLIQAETGETLSVGMLGFHATGYAFRRNGSEVSPQVVELPNLEGTGYLDGEDFSIYAPDSYSDRVRASGGDFFIEPDDTIAFDQVQTYYTLTRALKWFETKHNFSIGEHITVRTNAYLDGVDPENAQYIPSTGGRGPVIEIGAGSYRIQNLARDSDVAIHEFNHHVVYQFIDTRGGEALYLHEGYSDYFAYAINGDPYLGETILPGKPYLRTADQPSELRYDSPYVSRRSHEMGELWSTLLWEAREEIGTAFDEVAYLSLHYLDAQSDLEDGIMALFLADRDLFPKPSSDPEAGLYGSSKCTLIAIAVDRGYAALMGGVDGETCGYDLELEKVKSEETIARGADQDSGDRLRLFGIPCAVIGAQKDGSNPWILLILLSGLAPALFNVRPSFARTLKK